MSLNHLSSFNKIQRKDISKPIKRQKTLITKHLKRYGHNFTKWQKRGESFLKAKRLYIKGYKSYRGSIKPYFREL